MRGSGAQESFRLERTFPVVPIAAKLARTAAKAACVAWRPARGEPCEIISLAVSELVGNAVRHGCGGEVTVRLCMTPRRLRLEVVDADPTWPALRHAELTEECGRGLWLVSELATRWGVEAEAPGKRVWVEIALPNG
jgi:Histidine kinase-like ATPase domain